MSIDASLLNVPFDSIIKFGRTRKDAVDSLQVSSHSYPTVGDDEDVSPIAIHVNHYSADKAKVLECLLYLAFKKSTSVTYRFVCAVSLLYDF